MSACANDKLRSFFSLFYADLQHSQVKRPTEAINRQMARLRKKARFTDVDLTSVTLDSFRAANLAAREASISLTPVEVAEARSFILKGLDSFFYDYTGVGQLGFDLKTILELFAFGPGASLGSKHTHFVDKICQLSGTVTRDALPYAQLVRRLNPHLGRYDATDKYEFDLKEGSRITVVPKNETIGRTVCTEPLWNMALQLAAGAAIEGSLRRLGLDISSQGDKNKSLAQKGSIDGSLATIDLKWASDLITPSLIKELWPSSWFNFLMRIRSPQTEINGEWVELNMMSTMGNGFTFPLMTMTILALLSTVARHGWLDYDKWGVFGDDIICPSSDYDRVCDVLSRAGLMVNLDKSYSEGPFRESCGGDFHEGVDITPLYVKSLANDAQVYVVINGLTKWCLFRSIPLTDFETTFRFLYSLLPKGPLFVPHWEQDTSGIKTLSVRRNYYRLVPVFRRTRRRMPHDALHMLCALGGYGSSAEGSVLTYVRRSDEIDYKVERARLPKGFRDGGDYVLHSTRDLRYADCFHNCLAS